MNSGFKNNVKKYALLLKRNKKHHWVECHAQPVDQNGIIVGLTGQTRRLRLHNELRTESAKRFTCRIARTCSLQCTFSTTISTKKIFLSVCRVHRGSAATHCTCRVNVIGVLWVRCWYAAAASAPCIENCSVSVATSPAFCSPRSELLTMHS